MKKTTVALALSAGMGIFLAGGAYADEDKTKDKLEDVTCAQYLALSEDAQDDIVYWMAGVDDAQTKKEDDAGDILVGYDQFGKPLAAIVTACEADKKSSLWEKVKSVF